MWSTADFQGNSTGASRAWDLGPGTRSPAAVQTLTFCQQSFPFTDFANIPNPEDTGFSGLEVCTQSSHGPRGSHAGTDQADLWQLLYDLWSRPADVRLPVLRS